jgi:hypothetical protein
MKRRGFFGVIGAALGASKVASAVQIPTYKPLRLSFEVPGMKAALDAYKFPATDVGVTFREAYLARQEYLKSMANLRHEMDVMAVKLGESRNDRAPQSSDDSESGKQP